MENFEKQILKLESKKQKLKEKEKILKNREKVVSNKMLNTLGKFVVKAQLSSLDNEALLGALLEISDKSKDDKNLILWRERSQRETMHEINRNLAPEENAIIISFQASPSNDVKERLKKLKFKWNSFRSEYHGFGSKEQIENLFENVECTIEIVS